MREIKSVSSLLKRLGEGVLGWGENGMVSKRE